MPQQSILISRYPQKLKQKTTQRWKPLRIALSLLLTICFVSYGCTTMKIPDYPKTDVASFGNALTKNDLCIAVRAITNKEDLERYFGADLSKLKILPVYVVADNKSVSTSFLLSKDHILLQHKKTGDNVQKGAAPATGHSTGGEVAAVIGTATLSLPLLFVGLKAISDATVVKQNLAAKALQTRTVSPGKSVDGFVYFTLPKETIPLAEWSISVHVKELGSDSKHQFVFTLE